MRSQLLCTFTNIEKLEEILGNIQDTYNLVYNYIYVLQNKNEHNELYVTYNIDASDQPEMPLKDTILVHRKKETNTLYTINALNQMVKEENHGQLDRHFQIDWYAVRNSIVVTNSEGSRRIPTRIYEVIDFR